MVLNIYVARHGQDQDNSNGILNGHRDEPLTELGRQQAKDVAIKMQQAGFTLESTSKSTIANDTNKVVLSAVYSSPLQRAFDTANIFADALSTTSTTNKTQQQKVQVLDDLIERDFGIMTGQPTSSIIEKCGINNILVTEKINYFLNPQGAETFPNLIDRAKILLSHIEQIITSDGDEDDNSETSILIVTHGDFGKMIYAAYYNMPWKNVLRSFHFGNSEVLLLSRTSSPENAHVFETIQYNS